MLYNNTVRIITLCVYYDIKNNSSVNVDNNNIVDIIIVINLLSFIIIIIVSLDYFLQLHHVITYYKGRGT